MAARQVIINGRRQIDPRQTWAWRRLKDQVVAEEPNCWLRLPVCTGLSQTADHLITVKERPDLALVRANLRGICHRCNMARKSRPLELFTGPRRWDL